ncbi:MAG: hypothetical protein JG782_365 [Anaerophaga sp.]|nr:hypothetical protein [Anaerophaga sp.]MDI3520733.1 hypothetical protein [Anaerophaga sp.]MDK2842859.1 hypothetical protein [Anaerophaga sp.]MDN5291068.1 hypothetical protein [Anaerophaga sp.]
MSGNQAENGNSIFEPAECFRGLYPEGYFGLCSYFDGKYHQISEGV